MILDSDEIERGGNEDYGIDTLDRRLQDTRQDLEGRLYQNVSSFLPD